MSYLKRTGTGINDVQWDDKITLNDPNSTYGVELMARKSGNISQLYMTTKDAPPTANAVIIRNVAVPSSNTDVANKEYVDMSIKSAVPAGKFVETTGGTMTGELVLSGKPTQDNGAATKKYVDDALGGAAPAGDYLLKTGDTMTGNLNMSDNQITNVNTMTATNIIVKGTSDASASIKVTGDASRSELGLNDVSNNPVVLKGVDTPADNNDAANKQYVDAVDTKVTNLQGEVDGVKNTVTNITNGSTELPYLPIAGGTLTGTLTLSGAPTADLQAATKKYIDDKANDRTEIPVIPNQSTTDNLSKCYKHNKFIFLHLRFTDIQHKVGANNVKMFTLDTDIKTEEMFFHVQDIKECKTASGQSLGNLMVDFTYHLINNALYITYVSVAGGTSTLSASIIVAGSSVINQMFVVTE